MEEGGGGVVADSNTLSSQSSIAKSSRFFKPLVASSLTLALGVSVGMATTPTLTVGDDTTNDKSSTAGIRWDNTSNAYKPQLTSNSGDIANLIFNYNGTSGNGLSGSGDSSSYTISADSSVNSITLNAGGSSLQFGGDSSGLLQINFEKNNGKSFTLSNVANFNGGIKILGGGTFEANFSGNVAGDITISNFGSGNNYGDVQAKSNSTFTFGGDYSGNITTGVGTNNFVFTKENVNVSGSIKAQADITPWAYANNTFTFRGKATITSTILATSGAYGGMGINKIVFEKDGDITGEITAYQGKNWIVFNQNDVLSANLTSSGGGINVIEFLKDGVVNGDVTTTHNKGYGNNTFIFNQSATFNKALSLANGSLNFVTKQDINFASGQTFDISMAGEWKTNTFNFKGENNTFGSNSEKRNVKVTTSNNGLGGGAGRNLILFQASNSNSSYLNEIYMKGNYNSGTAKNYNVLSFNSTSSGNTLSVDSITAQWGVNMVGKNYLIEDSNNHNIAKVNTTNNTLFNSNSVVVDGDNHDYMSFMGSDYSASFQKLNINTITANELGVNILNVTTPSLSIQSIESAEERAKNLVRVAGSLTLTNLTAIGTNYLEIAGGNSTIATISSTQGTNTISAQTSDTISFGRITASGYRNSNNFVTSNNTTFQTSILAGGEGGGGYTAKNLFNLYGKTTFGNNLVIKASNTGNTVSGKQNIFKFNSNSSLENNQVIAELTALNGNTSNILSFDGLTQISSLTIGDINKGIDTSVGSNSSGKNYIGKSLTQGDNSTALALNFTENNWSSADYKANLNLTITNTLFVLRGGKNYINVASLKAGTISNDYGTNYIATSGDFGATNIASNWQGTNNIIIGGNATITNNVSVENKSTNSLTFNGENSRSRIGGNIITDGTTTITLAGNGARLDVNGVAQDNQITTLSSTASKDNVATLGLNSNTTIKNAVNINSDKGLAFDLGSGVNLTLSANLINSGVTYVNFIGKTGMLTSNITTNANAKTIFNLNSNDANSRATIKGAKTNNGTNEINFENPNGATLDWQDSDGVTQAISTTGGNTTNINFNQGGNIVGGITTDGSSATTTINIKNGANVFIGGEITTINQGSTNIAFKDNVTRGANQTSLTLNGKTNSLSSITLGNGNYQISLADLGNEEKIRDTRRSLAIDTLDTSSSTHSLTLISQTTATEADTFVIKNVNSSKQGKYNFGIAIDGGVKLNEIGTSGDVLVATIENNANAITFEKTAQIVGDFIEGTMAIKEKTEGNKTEYYLGNILTSGIALAEQEITATAFTLNYDLYMANLNSLNKRMGELRENNHSQGVWARVFNGALSNDFGLGSKSNYTTIQAGYDYAFGSEGANNYLGVALSYALSTSTSDYTFDSNGGKRGIDNIYSNAVEVALYNSYVMDSGWYNDSIAKFSYIMSSFDISRSSGTTTNDTTNFAFTLSDEVGYIFKFGESKEWSITPQIEATFGYFNQSDFKQTLQSNSTLNSMAESILTLRTRVGSAFAYDFKNFTQKDSFNASLYIGAFYEYDYVSGGEITMDSNAGIQNNELSNISSDGRVVMNVGTNMTIKDNTRLYFDFEKSFAGKINTDYQVNVGVRYSFGESDGYSPILEKADYKAPLKIEGEEKEGEEKAKGEEQAQEAGE